MGRLDSNIFELPPGFHNLHLLSELHFQEVWLILTFAKRNSHFGLPGFAAVQVASTLAARPCRAWCTFGSRTMQCVQGPICKTRFNQRLCAGTLCRHHLLSRIAGAGLHLRCKLLRWVSPLCRTQMLPGLHSG